VVVKRTPGDPLMPTGFGELKIFSGSAHPQLAKEIADFLGIPVGQARLRRFPDSEVSFQIDENIRGTDVFIVQPTSNPVDEHLMEMLVMIDAFRRSSAARITAVVPYYGYARQDRKDKPRVPISAKLVANLISAAGTQRVLTMDLHKAQIQGFFDIPVDHLFAAPVIIEYLARLNYPKLTIVSPDAGGAERARAYAKRLDAELAVIDKRRTEDGTAEVMNVIGGVEGRTCILQDDLIDTAGTIQKAATALKTAGAGRVLACAVHGVLSGPAIERIENSPVDQLIVTNTIPLGADAQQCKKIVVLSVARLLGQAIRSIHEETSVSSLFV
jgi:ribose-phosphate pyrophosphokinase